MLILKILSLLTFCAYAAFKAKREVHIMQQNSYFISRYWDWWKKNIKLAFAPAEVAGLVLGITTLPFVLGESLFANVLFIAIFAFAAYRFYKDKPKKALVITPRIKRLLGVMALIFVVKIAALWYLDINFFGRCRCWRLAHF